MSELKPCPFCGGDAKIVYDDNKKWFFITCGNEDCDLIVQGMWHTDLKKAIEEWNRRMTDEVHS